jgi:hypothetical protein
MRVVGLVEWIVTMRIWGWSNDITKTNCMHVRHSVAFGRGILEEYTTLADNAVLALHVCSTLSYEIIYIYPYPCECLRLGIFVSLKGYGIFQGAFAE